MVGAKYKIKSVDCNFVNTIIVYNLCSTVLNCGKTGFIAHLQVLRNADFKYSKFCSSPMVIAMHTKFSHIVQQCITFQIIQ